MGNFTLTPTATATFDLEGFAGDSDIWTETDSDKTTASRYTSDGERSSVMKFVGKVWNLGDGITLGDESYLGNSTDGAGEGVYEDYTVTAENVYSFSCQYKCDNTSAYMTILVYDQDNSATICTIDVNDATWSLYEAEVTVPVGCTTIRVKFLQTAETTRGGPFYVDDVGLLENALTSDPDHYTRIPSISGGIQEALSGKKYYDQRAVHYEHRLRWNAMEAGQFDTLYQFYKSGSLLYFNDGDVPAITESETIYDTAEKTFADVTAPSSTHKAYKDSSASLPSAEDDFDSTEYGTANYQAIDGDDTSYVATTNPTATYYLYHRFDVDPGIARASVRRFRVKVAALSDDSSAANTDGVVLYVYNHVDSAWVEIARTTNSSKNDLTYSTAEATVAQQFIDDSDDYVRLLVRSRAARNGTDALSLRVYYVEVEVNEDLDLVVDLSHRAVLDDDSDVIHVKNTTDGTTLTLTTDYTIASNRRSVTIVGEDSGDSIEVSYARYFEVAITEMPEEFLDGDPASDRYRNVEVVMETLSETPI